MKINTLVVSFVLSVAFSFVFMNTTVAQTETTELKPFSVKISLTENGAQLICYNGCSWETLSYEKINTAFIDFNGVSNKLTSKQDIPFSFTVEKQATSIVLKGLKGTKWDTLIIPCISGGCMLQVNQFGQVF